MENRRSRGRCTHLVHVVAGDGGDGNYLDADETGVSCGEDVGVAGPVESVHEDCFLRKHSNRSIVLDQRRKVAEVVRSHVVIFAHGKYLGCQ